MIILVSALLSVLTAQNAFAERRENTPFNTVNGRTSVGAPVAGPQVITVATPGGGVSSNSGAPEAPTAGPVATAGRAFYGGGRAAARAGRSVRGNQGASAQRVDTRKANRAGVVGVGARTVAATPADGGGTTTTSTEEAPPNFSKPGALIRDTGQAPVYDKGTVGTNTVDAGEIVFNNRKGFDVGRAPSIQQGPKDTLPPPNPGTFSRTTTGGAAANSGPSGSGGSGGGHDNNGSGNNDKDKPGDTTDGKGGDKTFADPTGFYSAF